ncbi:MAG TPA: hypothetical protein VHI52_09505, partial [Verrucomicrobiae bacterium]|nr:hypothetical protein [Verrucomicrobiae bacterium]
MVEIVRRELTHGERGHPGGLHGGFHRSRDVGVVAFDHDRGLESPRAPALGRGVAEIQLHRSLHRVGQLDAPIHKPGVLLG